VWRVQDTAQASFDVEITTPTFISKASSAVATWRVPYPTTGEEHELTLRSSVDEVSVALQKELQDRTAKRGVVIEEAR